MSAQQDLEQAILHVQAYTGSPVGWRVGLTQHDVDLAMQGLGADPLALAEVVAKIRANNPTLFDAGTGLAIVPVGPPRTGDPALPTDPAVQSGAAATALKKAESDLSQQNSATSAVDLLVVSAILNAHAATAAGADKLSALQREVESAVHSRTDLDTAAGARDFQRFLIGKLREIGALVQDTAVDDTSKAALATAWTALYDASKRVGVPGGPADPGRSGDVTPDASTSSDGSTTPAGAVTVPVGTATAPPTVASSPDEALGGDPFIDEYLEPGLGLSDPATQAVPTPSSPSPALTTPSSVPSATAPSSMWPSTSAPGSAWPDSAGVPSGLSSSPSDLDAALEDLLGSDPIDPSVGEPEDDVESDTGTDDPATDDDDPGAPEQAPDPQAALVVDLPDGGTVTAPTVEVAAAMRAALSGVPISEAFYAQGITIPPPGTPVTHPLDVGRIDAGDIGMFTDRLAMALDRSRAWFDGEVRPVQAISGPSFLGWLHPEGIPTSPGEPAAEPALTTPNGGTPPAPTRPAALAVHAG